MAVIDRFDLAKRTMKNDGRKNGFYLRVRNATGREPRIRLCSAGERQKQASEGQGSGTGYFFGINTLL